MKTRYSLIVALIIITCLGGISAALAQVQTTYSFIDLGSLGGTSASNTYVSTVNDAGMAVGESQTPTPDVDHAFLCTNAQTSPTMTDLGGLTKLKNGTAVTLDRSNAWGLDSAGAAVVGEAWNAAYESGSANPMIRAFLWNATTGMVDLGALGTGKNSNAYWINDNGWVVGRAETANNSGIFHAFYNTSAANKNLVDIDKRTGVNSAAWAVNNANQIVGEAETAAGTGIYQAFFWQKGMTAMKFLSPLPGGSSCGAYGLSYWCAVGTSDNGAGATHAAVWYLYRDGVLDLGTLGGNSSFSWGINEWGQVVGVSDTAAGDYHAFIWNNTEGMKDLNNLIAPQTLPGGVTLISASTINNFGQILAQAWDSSTGIYHVYLLTPNQRFTGLVWP